ncbi:MAG: flavin-containing monooxygenase [Blastococcus sp.]
METEHVDVLVVGAGISGIGAARHLRERFPDRTFVVLDALDSHGGTWRTHRYPGVRSDSDLFTFGYRFKPWRGPSIATSHEILSYLGEVIDENGLDSHIRYGHRVTAASWSSGERRWTVEATEVETGERLRFTTDFLWMCQGYYRHGQGYTPDWPGLDRYRGVVVHPQQWPDDLDHAGKRVVVIGSGATAATLVPALAPTAGHVTMLQRSPTFFVARPKTHELAVTLRALDIPEEWTHEILRRAYIAQSAELTRMSFESPDELRTFLLEEMRPLLPEGFDIDRHFSPRYRPWQQRLAVVPEGDLFAALREGTASVVTDTIETFTEGGIRLGSGDELEADIVITATGFDLSVFGDVAFTVDDEPVDFTQRVTYRGIMISGVPNMAYVFGYFRHSWTLRADLVSDFVCRLLSRMAERGASVVVPTLRPEDADMPLLPWADPENINSGYVMRSMHLMFRQGDREPWTHLHEYEAERRTLPAADLDDGTLVYRSLAAGVPSHPHESGDQVPVDPHIAAILAMLDEAGMPPLHEGTAEAGRAQYAALTHGARAPEQIVPVAATEDITVPGAHGQLRGRVYRPDGEGPFPTVAFFHGGGWVIGDLDTHDNMARNVCTGSRAVVVAIDYRLAPEHPFPAAAQDAVAAARWVAQHREELGGGALFAVAGDSAGGNLAAVAAQELTDEGVPVAGQFLIYPAVDAAGEYPSRVENATGYFLEQPTMDWFYGHYAGAWDDAKDPRLSPLHAADLSGLPPAVIVTAEFDPLRDEGEAYGEALRAAGVPVDVQRYDGMIHGFFDMGTVSPAAQAAIDERCARFGELLR